MLEARCHRSHDLAQVVSRVAQGAPGVSDLWFTFRTEAIQSIIGYVAESLVEMKFRFADSEGLAGRSGRGWKIEFNVRAESRSSLVQVLSTGSRSAVHIVSAHMLAASYDLNHLAAGLEGLAFVSLFDDTADVWENEDFRLVEPLSIVSRWSRRDVFADLLSGDA